MGFLQEPEPPRGVPQTVLPGVRRVVAANPGVMTYHGTNTFLIEDDEGLTIIDPGPRDAAHVRDILAAAGGRRISCILLTHTHADHWGATAELAAATGAPVAGYRHSARSGFTPDIPLDDEARIGAFTALHTPGHAADHLCFAFQGGDGAKILFSGDHVMSWSSSIVSPPEGDMLAYYRSLEKVLARDDDVYLCAHGPKLDKPRSLVVEMLAHRALRETAIIAELREQEWGVGRLAARLYSKSDPYLRVAAQRNVLAHILKLRDEGRVLELEPDEMPDPDLAGMAPPAGFSAADARRLELDARRRFRLA